MQDRSLTRFTSGWTLCLARSQLSSLVAVSHPTPHSASSCHAQAINPLEISRHLKKRKYRLMDTVHRKGKPGPKGPSQELIDAIVEMKRRNSRFSCHRISQEINKALGSNIDRDVVRRVLEKLYRPGHDSGHGPVMGFFTRRGVKILMRPCASPHAPVAGHCGARIRLDVRHHWSR